MKYIAILLVVVLQGCVSALIKSHSSFANDERLDSFGETVEIVRKIDEGSECSLIREVSRDDGYIIKGSDIIRINKLRNVAGMFYANKVQMLGKFKSKHFVGEDKTYMILEKSGEKGIFAKMWKCDKI